MLYGTIRVSKSVVSCDVCMNAMQAMDYARKLRDDRGRGNIVVVDDGDETEEQMGSDEFRVQTCSLAVLLKSRLHDTTCCQTG